MWRHGGGRASLSCRRIGVTGVPPKSFASTVTFPPCQNRTSHHYHCSIFPRSSIVVVVRGGNLWTRSTGQPQQPPFSHFFQGQRFLFSSGAQQYRDYTTPGGRVSKHQNNPVYEFDNEDEVETVLLYKRSRPRMPRILLGFSAFQTSYWSWYLVDFVPRMKEALLSGHRYDPLKGTYERVLVSGPGTLSDDLLGYIGFGMSCLMSLCAVTYPRCLVSEIRQVVHRRGGVEFGDGGDLYIKTHLLPFVTVPRRARRYEKVYVEGMAEWKTIHRDHEGRLSEFRGHLVLRINKSKKARSWWNPSNVLLLNIGDASEVKDEARLLRALLPLDDDDDYDYKDRAAAAHRTAALGNKSVPLLPPKATAHRGTGFRNIRKQGRRQDND